MSSDFRASAQKGIEAHEDFLPKFCMDHFCAVGHDVAALEPRTNDIAVFLGVGTLAEPGVFKVGPLSHEHVFTDPGITPDDCIPAERCPIGNRNGQNRMDHLEYLLKIGFAAFDEIHEYAGRLFAGFKMYVSFQDIPGKTVTEVEMIARINQYPSRYQ